MKEIRIQILEENELILVGASFPSSKDKDAESQFVKKLKPVLIQFLRELPIAKNIGYGESDESKEDALNKARTMVDIYRAGQ